MAIELINNKYYIDEPFYVVRNKNSRLLEEPVHTHDFFELIYVCKGKSEHVSDGKKYAMQKGDMLFVNFGSTHSFVSDGSFEYINIIIKPGYISKSLSDAENAFALLTHSDFVEFSETINTAKKCMHFNEKEQESVETIIGLMEKEISNKTPGRNVILRSGLDVLLTLVFRKMSLPLCEQMNLNAELLAYIEQNCGEFLTLKKVASLCFYNSSYFSRAFKAYVGESFMSYLTKCRINRACELLKNSNLKINVIMEKCGFSNRTAFFRRFYDKTGLTPLQYRKCKSKE